MTKQIQLDKIRLLMSRPWSGFPVAGTGTSGQQLPGYHHHHSTALLARPLSRRALPRPGYRRAADEPAPLTGAHVESFKAWMIATRSAATR